MYATTLQLARYLNIENKIPSMIEPGASRAKELVGTGDSSNTLFYLDQAWVLASSYALYKGATEAAATLMTETTHYVLDKDSGTITLTSAGVTLVATSNIYASYSYCSIMLTDTQLQEALDRAENEIERKMKTRFVTASDTTPSWVAVSNETKRGKGKYDDDYYTNYGPIASITATLGTALPATSGTATVASTTGFPSSGTFLLGTDKVTYTSKASTQFLGCSDRAAAYASGDIIYPFIVEIATDDKGSAPTWEVLTYLTDYFVDISCGRININCSKYPKDMIPDRFRITYLYGYDTIPAEITRLALMIAAKDLMHLAVRKAVANGMSDFRPENFGVDEDWIKETFDRYRFSVSSNV